ncbi:RNA-directed DNA polymerase, eukaryota, reverse transcriptase zinc-binding domain protein [Tanacetum coccineum]
MKVIKNLESFRQRFFWGGTDEVRKIAWVKFRVEENRPWVKIVKSIYGEDGGLTHDGMSSRSGESKRVDTLKRWLLDADDGRFMVKMLRELIDEKILHSTDGSQETKWNKVIPRKVCIMIWRLQQRRLPVLSWLHHIDIDLNSSLCPHCGNATKSLEHYFIHFSRVMKCWESVFKWQNMGNCDIVSLDDILDHKGKSSS